MDPLETVRHVTRRAVFDHEGRYLDLRYVVVDNAVDFILATMGEMGVKTERTDSYVNRVIELAEQAESLTRIVAGMTVYSYVTYNFHAKKSLIYLGVKSPLPMARALTKENFQSIDTLAKALAKQQFFSVERVRYILEHLQSNQTTLLLYPLFTECLERRDEKELQGANFYEAITSLAMQGIALDIYEDMQRLIQATLTNVPQVTISFSVADLAALQDTAASTAPVPSTKRIINLLKKQPPSRQQRVFKSSKPPALKPSSPDNKENSLNMSSLIGVDINIEVDGEIIRVINSDSMGYKVVFPKEGDYTLHEDPRITEFNALLTQIDEILTDARVTPDSTVILHIQSKNEYLRLAQLYKLGKFGDSDPKALYTPKYPYVAFSTSGRDDSPRFLDIPEVEYNPNPTLQTRQEATGRFFRAATTMRDPPSVERSAYQHIPTLSDYEKVMKKGKRDRDDLGPTELEKEELVQKRKRIEIEVQAELNLDMMDVIPPGPSPSFNWFVWKPPARSAVPTPVSETPPPKQFKFRLPKRSSTTPAPTILTVTPPLAATGSRIGHTDDRAARVEFTPVTPPKTGPQFPRNIQFAKQIQRLNEVLASYNALSRETDRIAFRDIHGKAYTLADFVHANPLIHQKAMAHNVSNPLYFALGYMTFYRDLNTPDIVNDPFFKKIQTNQYKRIQGDANLESIKNLVSLDPSTDSNLIFVLGSQSDIIHKLAQAQLPFWPNDEQGLDKFSDILQRESLIQFVTDPFHFRGIVHALSPEWLWTYIDEAFTEYCETGLFHREAQKQTKRNTVNRINNLSISTITDLTGDDEMEFIDSFISHQDRGSEELFGNPDTVHTPQYLDTRRVGISFFVESILKKLLHFPRGTKHFLDAMVERQIGQDRMDIDNENEASLPPKSEMSTLEGFQNHLSRLDTLMTFFYYCYQCKFMSEKTVLGRLVAITDEIILRPYALHLKNPQGPAAPTNESWPSWPEKHYPDLENHIERAREHHRLRRPRKSFPGQDSVGPGPTFDGTIIPNATLDPLQLNLPTKLSILSLYLNRYYHIPKEEASSTSSPLSTYLSYSLRLLLLQIQGFTKPGTDGKEFQIEGNPTLREYLKLHLLPPRRIQRVALQLRIAQQDTQISTLTEKVKMLVSAKAKVDTQLNNLPVNTHEIINETKKAKRGRPKFRYTDSEIQVMSVAELQDTSNHLGSQIATNQKELMDTQIDRNLLTKTLEGESPLTSLPPKLNTSMTAAIQNVKQLLMESSLTSKNKDPSLNIGVILDSMVKTFCRNEKEMRLGDSDHLALPYFDHWCDFFSLNIIRSMTDESDSPTPIYGLDPMFTFGALHYVGLNKPCTAAVSSSPSELDGILSQIRDLEMKMHDIAGQPFNMGDEAAVLERTSRLAKLRASWQQAQYDRTEATLHAEALTRIQPRLQPIGRLRRFDLGKALLNFWLLSYRSMTRDTIQSWAKPTPQQLQSDVCYMRLFLPRVPIDAIFLQETLPTITKSALIKTKSELRFIMQGFDNQELSYTLFDLKERLHFSKPGSLHTIKRVEMQSLKNPNATGVTTFLDLVMDYIYDPRFFRENPFRYKDLRYYHHLLTNAAFDVMEMQDQKVSSRYRMDLLEFQAFTHADISYLTTRTFKSKKKACTLWINHLVRMIDTAFEIYKATCFLLAQKKPILNFHSKPSLFFTTLETAGVTTTTEDNDNQTTLTNIDTISANISNVSETFVAGRMEPIQRHLLLRIEMMFVASLSYFLKTSRQINTIDEASYRIIINSVLKYFIQRDSSVSISVEEAKEPSHWIKARKNSFPPDLFVATFGHIMTISDLSNVLQTRSYFYTPTERSKVRV